MLRDGHFNGTLRGLPRLASETLASRARFTAPKTRRGRTGRPQPPVLEQHVPTGREVLHLANLHTRGGRLRHRGQGVTVVGCGGGEGSWRWPKRVPPIPVQTNVENVKN